MADVVSSVTAVVRLAVKIMNAVETVRRNKEECRKIKNKVAILCDIVAPMENIDLSAFPGARAALGSFEGVLKRAHDVVTDCSGSNNFLWPRNLSKQLAQVDQDIRTQMQMLIFATNVPVFVAFVRTFEAPEDAGLVENINYTTSIVEGSGHDYSISFKLPPFPFSELEAATDNFSGENEMLKGAFTTVYKGVLPDGRKIVIKTYPGDQPSCQRRHPDQPEPQDLYVNVYLLLSEDQHENIVLGDLLGHSKGGQWNYMLVEEAISKTSLLSEKIINGSSQQLDWSSTFNIIQGIARGVDYIHSKGVLHLNLTPASIVFDSDMNPKICDFEMSKILEDGVTVTVSLELVGTTAYMAPEYIVDGVISRKSDVFSFGVLVLRTISAMGNLVLDQHPIEWAWELREAKKLDELIDPSLCEESELTKIEKCIDIGLLCTQEDPEERPSMLTVLGMLNGEKELTTPTKPGFIKK